MNFIEDLNVDDLESQLRLLLSNPAGGSVDSSPWTDLDKLYLQILEQSFGEHQLRDMTYSEPSLARLLCLRTR
jgi:hypothetical protein